MPLFQEVCRGFLHAKEEGWERGNGEEGGAGRNVGAAIKAFQLCGVLCPLGMEHHLVGEC